VELFGTLLRAVSVFVVTNIDDILLLSLFFADAQVRPWAVISGQFLGIGAIVVVSVVSGMAADAVPEGVLRYTGLVPLLLGLWKLIELWRAERADAADEALDRLPARVGFAPQVLGVAGVTIANGGDNLGAYIPLFAAKPATIPVYALVFTVMTAVWCGIGFVLVHNPMFGSRLERYGQIALPIVLILLGLEILAN